MTGIQTDSVIAVVSLSGGKDSTATAKLAIDRYGQDRVRLVLADTGHEHEITLDHATNYLPQALGLPVTVVKAEFSADIARKRAYIRDKWPGKGVSDAKVEQALSLLHPTGIPFLDLCMMKGRFPSRMAQFCTHELKIKPINAYMRQLIADGYQVESWQGVRRDESRNRRNALEREWSDENGWWIERPIVDWTAEEVFTFLAVNGLEANPLYRMGCSRVGCMLCINSGKDEIANAAARWPHTTSPGYGSGKSWWGKSASRASRRCCITPMGKAAMLSSPIRPVTSTPWSNGRARLAAAISSRCCVLPPLSVAVPALTGCVNNLVLTDPNVSV